MRLEACGETLELSQIGPENIILRDLASLPPCQGEVVMLVDGHERRWQVQIPEGVVYGNRLVPIVPRAPR